MSNHVAVVPSALSAQRYAARLSVGRFDTVDPAGAMTHDCFVHAIVVRQNIRRRRQGGGRVTMFDVILMTSRGTLNNVRTENMKAEAKK